MRKFLPITALLFLCISCNSQQQKPAKPAETAVKPIATANNTIFDTTIKTIHVIVALCDNKYQGIVPVPAGIGNGQDPNTNLYWGCGYGVRSYFKASKNWTFIRRYAIDSTKLERAIFKHKQQNYYLIADAYNGKFIKQSTLDFFNSCAGIIKDTLHVADKIIGINGNAKLVAYIGHDGLMDFKLDTPFNNADGRQRDAIMLACYSKHFFGPHLKNTQAKPLVWSTHLMSPEAYTLHDALETYIAGQPQAAIRNSAAKAYSKYQKCSVKAASNLLVTGY